MTNAATVQGMRGGLSESEAKSRLAGEGYNELPRPESRTPLGIIAEVMREPMLALLLAGGGVYLVLGDLQEAIILLVFACLSIVITIVQETRTERVLQALRDLTSPRALVIRDGERRRIAGRDVVRGDLLVLSEGDRVAADAVVLQGNDLQTDESLLTGESVPVRKIARDAVQATQTPPRPGGDDLPYVFSGSLIVRGTAVAEVTATGLRSEIGKIGQSLSSLKAEPPRLQHETRRIVRVFGLTGAAISVFAGLLYGLRSGGWLAAVLAGITLGMSMLPEEFPVVLTVFMAMGAWRISRAHVLTRRAAAIEALGSATFLCTDKTGTLTENRMSISELRSIDGNTVQIGQSVSSPLPDNFREILRSGVLASDREPFDPMEQAFHRLSVTVTRAGEAVPANWRITKTYGLRRDLLAVTQIWQAGDEASLRIAAKGAPEAIARLCRLSPAETEAVKAESDSMAKAGLRVLGVACGAMTGRDFPATPDGLPLTFLGLVGLSDPVRASVPAAIAECRSAGITVVMITGDYPATATAIAAQAGIDARAVISGDDLLRLSDADLAEEVKTARIFARIMPEQKLRIVKALKANGEVVAMTGDGVNDAPCLKAADIGIAMGGRGTDVAREAAAIILLDDDFGSIVKAVRLGRRIYDNLRKAMAFILAVHVPIAGLALLPLITGLPIIFGPIHIAFLEMVIDPVCSLVFEAETAESNIMRRPPRHSDERLFSARVTTWSIFQGIVALALPVGVYLLAVHKGMPENEVRAITFLSLVTAILALIFVNRSFSSSLTSGFRRPNPALIIVLSLVFAILGLALWWPAARELFRFGPMHADDLAITLGTGIVVLALLDGIKPLWRPRIAAAANHPSH